MYVRYLHLCVILAVALIGCDTTGEQVLETEYVVESILVAQQPLPALFLSRTVNLDEDYSFEEHAVSEARVTVRVSGPLERAAIRYEEEPGVPGVYRPIDYYSPAFPLHQYELEIYPPNSDPVITAVTVVPDTFSVIDATQSVVVYQSDEQLELTLTRTQSPGRTLGYYNFVTEAVEPRVSNLVPLALELYENGEGESLENLRINGSPIISSESYQVNNDGTLSVRYPWIGINFYGVNIVNINALDDNLYDFERSREVQEGGPTFAPGEIPNPLPHIQGAHGLFGSLARVSIRFNVLAQ